MESMDSTDAAREMINAARDGNLDEVQKLITAGRDVNSKDEYGGTPLMEAANKGHEAVVAWLLDKGADVNPERHNSESALLFAVWRRHLKTVELLIKAGADVNSRCRGEPLIKFAYYPKPYGRRTKEQEAVDCQIVKMLLEAGANPNERDDMNGWTFIMYCEEPELLSLAIEKGADINAIEPSGNPVLFFHFTQLENLKILISKGADIEMRNGNGYTPLMNAAYLNHREAVEVLIEQGASLDATAEDAIYSGRKVDALKLALDGKHSDIVSIIKKNKKGFFGRLFGG